MTSVRSKKYLLSLLLGDGLAFICAYLLFYYVRVRSGLFEVDTIPDLVIPLLVITLFWYVLFWISGLYRPWWAKSRVDELIVAAKTISYGAFVVFLLIFFDDAITREPSPPRLRIVLYWALLLLFVGTERMLVRSLRRRMLIAGIGRKNTLLIGPRDRALALYRSIADFPALGFRIVGQLAHAGETAADDDPLPVLGTLDDLEAVIPARDIEEIIITLDSTEHDRLLDIIGRCSSFPVRIKIRPDLYDIVSGQARTNQLYGVPLVEVSPQLMSPWEEFLKRAIDIGVAAAVLVAGLPLLLAVAIIQKLTSRGPVLYRQQRVGKDGAVFNILKFRTMYVDAEKRGGPQWARKDDPRVTPYGRFLRRSHLDELPQVINVLKGDMSIVGPRPERPFFVEQFIREIPLYRRRLNVRPGITGWAQVKHRYDQSIEDVKTKLSYDLFYIENMSIRMDLKIIISTAYNMLAGKGHT
jgi:exopolysaccharide biosynthesis polyprenyl glycosylphosphotransferase